VEPNGRGALEGNSKILELFAASLTTPALVLQDVAHRYRPHFRPPISATLRNQIDEQQYRLTMVKIV
jgi:hypothetical protein